MPSLVPRSTPFRCLLLALAAASTAAGCGSSERPAASLDPVAARASAAVELTETTPPSALYAIEGRRSVPAGATRVTVRNLSARERGAQIVRVEGRRGPRRVLAAVRAASAGRPLPRWLQWAGGVGVIRPRSKVSLRVDLRPGRHYVVDRSYERAHPGAVRGSSTLLTVTRAREQALLPAAATITARDYAFHGGDLRAGRRLVKLRNAGAQPHDVVIAPIVPGRTLDDVRAFALGDESGPPPVDFSREVISGVLAPGQAQTLAVDLRPGSYALLCFASDRKGGPPHVVKGMLAETRVR